MKFKIPFFFAAFLFMSCGTSNKVVTSKNSPAVSSPIYASMDLTAIQNDKVPVIINPGSIQQETVLYRLPKVVQGTYSVSDFGAYVDAFKALDYKGQELPVKKLDTNTWEITNATNLDKISYLVNDTFDMENGEKEMPFSPSGTNIESTNYVLNLHGFIGYFDNLKQNKYTLDVISPKDFTKTAALHQSNVVTSEDGTIETISYQADRYFDITDNPMMYGVLDVEKFMVGDIEIVLSVYSPNKVHSAAGIKATMVDMMQAQKNYLGAINTTPRYDIYLYLSDMKETSPKGFGALEHHTSTVVVLPETMSDEALASSMTDVVSHEFFHIVTPLSVHSEDVHYFDYNDPTFSKHLWMYEGVTEYFATHFQVYEGLVSADEFLTKVSEKIAGSLAMDDSMSFTVMSENILEEPYASNYINVYQKGALIGMCIDIIMREQSNGERGILSLMKELSLKYGVHKPFVDDALIAEITAMTYPEVGAFLQKHVVGTTPINYQEFFDKVGVAKEESKKETSYIMNGRTLIFDANPEKNELFFNAEVANNSFWAGQGVQEKDVLVSVEGQELTLANAQQIVGGMFAWTPGKEIKVVVKRDGVTREISTALTQSYTTGSVLKINANATTAQNALRKAWIKQ